MSDNLTTIEIQRGTDYALDVARDDLFKVRAALKARDARIAELERKVEAAEKLAEKAEDLRYALVTYRDAK